MANQKPMKSVKFVLIGGKATPNPVLGQAGINMQEFIQQFNDQTSDRTGETVPVKLYVNEDKSFTFTTTLIPATELIMKAANIKKGSGNPKETSAGEITEAKLREIAEYKLPDLNTTSIDAAVKTIEGSAKSLGLKVVK